MKQTRTLLKEAIAGADDIRKTALEQARITLEEAFAPRLQSMFASRLSEEMEEFENEDPEDVNLEEILAELDMEGDEELNEAKKDEEEVEKKEADDDDDEKEVKELSMDELEEIIRDIVSQEMGEAGEEPEVNDGDVKPDEELPGEAPEEGEDLDLDEILQELMGDEDEDNFEDEEPVQENQEVLRLREDLKLALETVNHLTQQLNEGNLLSAKLLYLNKIFKARNLQESQKVKIVKSFDKATTAKEAKLIYESINETLSAKPEKHPIRESLGFASKAAGVAPQKNVIVDGDEWKARMQKLANIK